MNKFQIQVNSKLSCMVKYCIENYGMQDDLAYKRVKNTYLYSVLCNKSSRLYLESIYLLYDALDIEFNQGYEAVKYYLERNIGG